VFYGSPADAVPPLCALVAAGHDVALVVTQPDRRRGRRGTLVPTPVGRAAQELGLPVRTPARARETLDEVRALRADLGVVVAFGQLLPEPLLEAVDDVFVNLHFSLLPRWRGAAPVERAILAGDAETGVCLMRVDRELDAGPVYASARTPIRPDDTAGTLRERLVAIGTELLVAHVPLVATTVPTPQSGTPTYADKLTVDEFRLDPADDATALERRVRAGNPRPGAWCTVRGRRVKVWRAHAGPPATSTVAVGAVGPDGVLGTAGGSLVLDEVQPEGKRPMTGGAWRAGLRGDVRLDGE
jgi:methionyl-tRNA formyltransferase